MTSESFRTQNFYIRLFNLSKKALKLKDELSIAKQAKFYENGSLIESFPRLRFYVMKCSLETKKKTEKKYRKCSNSFSKT